MAEKEEGEKKYEANYNDEAQVEQYAGARWVDEVGSKVVDTIAAIRPFKCDDTFVDFGAGPGKNIEKIFYHGTRQDLMKFDENGVGPIVGDSALLVDIAPEMLKKAAEIASVRCPDVGVFCKKTNAFNGNEISNDFKQLMKMLPKLNCAMSSLVMEYLTDEQIVSMANILIDKVEFGGVVAFFDWCEHFTYPEKFADEIHHMRGFTKQHIMRLAGEIVEEAEYSKRVLNEEGDRRDHTEAPSTDRRAINMDNLFASKPGIRLRCEIGTFDCEYAYTQGCPSGDAVHYMIFVKEQAAGKYPSNKPLMLLSPRHSKVGFPTSAEAQAGGGKCAPATGLTIDTDSDGSAKRQKL